MKRTRNYLTAILMIVIGLISLTGCGQKKATAYQSYVKNLLDVNYKGDYTNYKKKTKEMKPTHSLCIRNVCQIWQIS